MSEAQDRRLLIDLHFDHRAADDLLVADLRDRSGIGNNESRRERRQISPSITVEAALDDEGILLELLIFGWYPSKPAPIVIAEGKYDPSDNTASLWFENTSPAEGSSSLVWVIDSRVAVRISNDELIGLVFRQAACVLARAAPSIGAAFLPYPSNGEVRALLAHLLADADFPGADALRAQAEQAHIVGGPVTFLDLEVPRWLPASPAYGPVPVDGHAVTPEGDPYGLFLIWARTGYIDALDFSWYGGYPSIRLPDLAQISVQQMWEFRTGGGG